MRQLNRLLLPILLCWIPFATIAECDPSIAWDANTPYERRDMVTYELHNWTAKRSTIGVIPGTHKPSWADQGPCDDAPTEPPGEPTPLQIYGVWHAGDHYADWSQPVDMVQFDHDNNWLIAGNNGKPSVNLVVLSFLQPLDVLNMDINDPASGVPVGMTMDIVNYFKDAGIQVMMSIGGITYVDFWDQALAQNATQLGLNAAAIATEYGTGTEIDYEQNTNPDLEGLQEFIDAYRSVHPITDGTPESFLTIDLAAGGRYLQDLNRHATIHWLDPDNLVLNYANAMVHRASGSPSNWGEHIDGMPTYDPPIPPKPASLFTGGLFLKGSMDNCTNFDGSEQKQHASYVQSEGMRGFMFWAAGVPSARKNYVPTTPPNSCEDGMGRAAAAFGITVP